MKRWRIKRKIKVGSGNYAICNTWQFNTVAGSLYPLVDLQYCAVMFVINFWKMKASFFVDFE